MTLALGTEGLARKQTIILIGCVSDMGEGVQIATNSVDVINGRTRTNATQAPLQRSRLFLDDGRPTELGGAMHASMAPPRDGCPDQTKSNPIGNVSLSSPPPLVATSTLGFLKLCSAPNPIECFFQKPRLVQPQKLLPVGGGSDLAAAVVAAADTAASPRTRCDTANDISYKYGAHVLHEKQ